MIPPLGSAFHFCPRCRSSEFKGSGENGFFCASCELLFYLNIGAAVAAFVQDKNGEILLIRRAHEPGRGLWAPPGGFVGVGENAETAVGREVFEETGLKIENVRYLGSAPNSYEFRGHAVPVLDFFFKAEARGQLQVSSDEVSDFIWLPVEKIVPEMLAFASMRAALKMLSEQPK